MTWYLRNTWYAAAFEHELDGDFLARTICGVPLVLFRKADGTLAAIHDRCPHRLVPLSLGKRVGDTIMCGYHGLRFDGAGTCVELPFEHGMERPDVCVTSYPLVGKDTIAWIWMGDADKADPAQIPEFWPLSDPGYRTAYGVSHFKCNHLILSDNLLDLSHVHILHPGIHDGTDYASFRNEIEVKGREVWSWLWRPHYAVNEVRREQWGLDVDEGEGQGHTRWTAPSNLLVDSAVWKHGEDVTRGARFPSIHLLTPETEYSTFYLWGSSRNFLLDDEEHQRQSEIGVRTIFETQDGPMAEAQQRAMGEETDLLKLRPAILKADKAGVLARRLLQRLIREENAPASPNAEREIAPLG